MAQFRLKGNQALILQGFYNHGNTFSWTVECYDFPGKRKRKPWSTRTWRNKMLLEPLKLKHFSEGKTKHKYNTHEKNNIS